MAPATQYVFAEMLGISEHFTAGSHDWLPYSVIPAFLKLICKHQFVGLLRNFSEMSGKGKIIDNCQFGEAVQTPIYLVRFLTETREHGKMNPVPFGTGRCQTFLGGYPPFRG